METVRRLTFVSDAAEAKMLELAEVLADFRSYGEIDDRLEVTPLTRTSEGETALHWMATLGDANAIDLLLAAGANINATDNEGNTPLHAAVASRQVVAVAKLIAGGAKIDLQNRAGLTPMHVAKVDGFEPVINLLRVVDLPRM